MTGAATHFAERVRGVRASHYQDDYDVETLEFGVAQLFRCIPGLSHVAIFMDQNSDDFFEVLVTYKDFLDHGVCLDNMCERLEADGRVEVDEEGFLVLSEDHPDAVSLLNSKLDPLQAMRVRGFFMMMSDVIMRKHGGFGAISWQLEKGELTFHDSEA